MARAVNRTSRNEYGSAMADIRRCYRLIGEDYASDRAPIHLNVLAALVALRTAAYALAIGSSTVVVVQLREGRGNYNSAERAHLDRYARMVAERAAYLSGSSVPWAPSAENRRPIEGKIRGAILNAFPLPAQAL